MNKTEFLSLSYSEVCYDVKPDEYPSFRTSHYRRYCLQFRSKIEGDEDHPENT